MEQCQILRSMEAIHLRAIAIRFLTSCSITEPSVMHADTKTCTSRRFQIQKQE